MNVYDFDNTIYRGESTLDFYFFCIRKNKRLLRLIPQVFRALILYKLCRMPMERLELYVEKYASEFLHMLGGIDEMSRAFWDRRMNKIKDFYKKQQREDDLIISASCDFLLAEGLKRLGIKNYLCSSIDPQTGQIKQLCYHKNKAGLYKRCYPNVPVENFYTDSMNDLPMIELAEHAFLVKGNRISQLK